MAEESCSLVLIELSASPQLYELIHLCSPVVIMMVAVQKAAYGASCWGTGKGALKTVGRHDFRLLLAKG
jgi:hypothetical protein